jgi:phosphoglycerate dehydrogenase-like enzyme
MRVAVLDDYQNVAADCTDWSVLGPDVQVDFFHDHLVEHDEIVARLVDYDVVVLMRERTPVRADLVQALPNLRLLVTTGANNAAVDVRAVRDAGIVMSGTRGGRQGTVEFTWALFFAIARRVETEHRAILEGRWQTRLGFEWGGKTLGLVGLGGIGSEVARVAQVFGMNVIAWSQNLQPEAAAEKGVRAVSQAELFESSDLVSVHLVWSKRTRGLIGAEQLNAMKPTAWFVNTSRGPIVQEAALIDVLRERRIAGAGLDVYDVEPLPPDHPFRSLDNVLMTPHIGFVTEEAYRRFFDDVVEDIVAFRDGAPIRTIEPRK